MKRTGIIVVIQLVLVIAVIASGVYWYVTDHNQHVAKAKEIWWDMLDQKGKPEVLLKAFWREINEEDVSFKEIGITDKEYRDVKKDLYLQEAKKMLASLRRGNPEGIREYDFRELLRHGDITNHDLGLSKLEYTKLFLKERSEQIEPSLRDFEQAAYDPEMGLDLLDLENEIKFRIESANLTLQDLGWSEEKFDLLIKLSRTQRTVERKKLLLN